MAALLKYKLFIIFGLLMIVEGIGLCVFMGGLASSASANETGDGRRCPGARHHSPNSNSATTRSAITPWKGAHFASTARSSPRSLKSTSRNSKRLTNRKSTASATPSNRSSGPPATATSPTPDLGAVKRKLKKAITDVVGSDKPYVSQIIVSDFQSYEL